jgi:hypothetical protein
MLTEHGRFLLCLASVLNSAEYYFVSSETFQPPRFLSTLPHYTPWNFPSPPRPPPRPTTSYVYSYCISSTTKVRFYSSTPSPPLQSVSRSLCLLSSRTQHLVSYFSPHPDTSTALPSTLRPSHVPGKSWSVQGRNNVHLALHRHNSLSSVPASGT